MLISNYIGGMYTNSPQYLSNSLESECCKRISSHHYGNKLQQHNTPRAQDRMQGSTM